MTKEQDWLSVADEFGAEGQYRYIEVDRVTPGDWQNVLDLLHRDGAVIQFGVDGVALPAPRDASQMLDYGSRAAVVARVKIEGVEYDWFIQTPTLLSFSLRPTVRSAAEFDCMCRFVKLLHSATKKPVEINLEGISTIATFAGPDAGFVWSQGGGASMH